MPNQTQKLFITKIPLEYSNYSLEIENLEIVPKERKNKEFAPILLVYTLQVFLNIYP